jgi:hypothetical protein
LKHALPLILLNKAEALLKSESEETMSRSVRFFSSLCFLLTILSFSAEASTPARTWRVQWEPARIVNGSPVLFRVTAPASLQQLSGEFLGQALSFRRFADTATRVLVNGLPGGIAWRPDGTPFSVVAFTVRGGRIVRIDIVGDRERLEQLDLQALAR